MAYTIRIHDEIQKGAPAFGAALLWQDSDGSQMIRGELFRSPTSRDRWVAWAKDRYRASITGPTADRMAQLPPVATGAPARAVDVTTDELEPGSPDWLVNFDKPMAEHGRPSCDWGDCDRAAITLRFDRGVTGNWLPVCPAHRIGGSAE